jgi:hypothetical protein
MGKPLRRRRLCIRKGAQPFPRVLQRTAAKVRPRSDGEGRNGVWLAEQGLDVLSIDFSPTVLRNARALAAEPSYRPDGRYPTVLPLGDSILSEIV